ncbi:translation initiation factor 3 RNA-binding subunit [Mycena floridula]|nr:translation initiation factor 3 RNA-binding subunit [Mycena floridula]
MPEKTRTSWADDVDELAVPSPAPSKLVPIEEDENVRTTVEFVLNDEGKRVKVGETVMLQLSAGNKASEAEQNAAEEAKKPVRAGTGKVVCRLCKGEHFTAKCPYKDRLAEMDSTDTGAGPDDEATGVPTDAALPPSGLGTSSGKYVPPSIRGGGSRPGESMRGGPGGNRDDLPTLRVTNISEDTQENDLRDLFGVFGRVARVYVGRDRETGAGKGFAFVSFEERSVAQKAMEKVNGRGYDNLILSVQWSQPRPDQGGR